MEIEFCYERSALQSVNVRWSSGNDDIGPLFSLLFSSIFLFFVSIATFSHIRSAQIKKNLFSES